MSRGETHLIDGFLQVGIFLVCSIVVSSQGCPTLSNLRFAKEN
jgi:hypothetical protein